MSDRLMFQGKCLKSTEGWLWMTEQFDQFPPSVRERARNSPFNLCAACIDEIALCQFSDGSSYTDRLIKAIESMENQIRCEEITSEAA